MASQYTESITPKERAKLYLFLVAGFLLDCILFSISLFVTHERLPEKKASKVSRAVVHVLIRAVPS